MRAELAELVANVPWPVAVPLRVAALDPMEERCATKRINFALFAAYQTVRVCALIMLAEYCELKGKHAGVASSLARMHQPTWGDWSELAKALAAGWSPPERRFSVLSARWRAVIGRDSRIRNIRNDYAHNRVEITGMCHAAQEARLSELLGELHPLIRGLFPDKLIGIAGLGDSGGPVQLIGEFKGESGAPPGERGTNPGFVAWEGDGPTVRLSPFFCAPRRIVVSRISGPSRVSPAPDPVLLLDNLHRNEANLLGVSDFGRSQEVASEVDALLDTDLQDGPAWVWERLRGHAKIRLARAMDDEAASGKGDWYQPRAEYENLVRQPKERRPLLFVGEPGCGKSSLLLHLSRKLADKDTELVVYVCAAELRFGSERPGIGSAVGATLGIPATDVGTLESMLKRLVEVCPGRVWVVIDALDEATDAGSLWREIAPALKSPTDKLSLLLSTRDGMTVPPELRDGFRQLPDAKGELAWYRQVRPFNKTEQKEAWARRAKTSGLEYGASSEWLRADLLLPLHLRIFHEAYRGRTEAAAKVTNSQGVLDEYLNQLFRLYPLLAEAGLKIARSLDAQLIVPRSVLTACEEDWWKKFGGVRGLELTPEEILVGATGLLRRVEIDKYQVRDRPLATALVRRAFLNTAAEREDHQAAVRHWRVKPLGLDAIFDILAACGWKGDVDGLALALPALDESERVEATRRYLLAVWRGDLGKPGQMTPKAWELARRAATEKAIGVFLGEPPVLGRLPTLDELRVHLGRVDAAAADAIRTPDSARTPGSRL